MPESMLEGLDPQQRVAAERLGGPVAILAGAGSGKTRTITHRIAYGVATGRTSASRTMALTFTARAAAELRARLRVLGAGAVQARTFHAAALAQLSHFWPRVVGGRPPALLASKAGLVAEAAERIGLEVGPAAVRDLASEIERRKVSDASIEEWEALGRTLPGLGAADVAAVQRAYEDLKDERRRMDFEDVLLATAGMLAAEPAVLRAVRDQYRTFVVDEYQDVSPIQQRLLMLWLGDRRDLCVVGDANQTIYSFAGASSSYLTGFRAQFPDALVVRLEVSYRSTQPILDTANRLMAGLPGSLRLTASTSEAAAPVPAFAEYPTELREAEGVAEAVAAELADGIPPQRIAVLVRVAAQVPLLQRALQQRGIGAAVRGDARFFEQPAVREAVVHLMAARRSASADEPAVVTARAVLSGLGWTPSPTEAGRERWAALDALHRLAVEAGAKPFGRYVDELLERQAVGDEPVGQAVTISTMHAAKGLEWDAVHIVGMSEGLMPIVHAVGDEELAEERRLLYVAITRARRRLRLTRAASGRAPSRFLEDLWTTGDGGGQKRA